MLENPRRVLHCFHQDLSASACPVYEKVIYIELRFAVKHRVDGVQDKCVETRAGYSAKYLAVVPVGHCAPAGNHALEGERLQRHQRLQHITVHVFELVDMFQGQSTETAFLEAFPADGAQNQHSIFVTPRKKLSWLSVTLRFTGVSSRMLNRLANVSGINMR